MKYKSLKDPIFSCIQLFRLGVLNHCAMPADWHQKADSYMPLPLFYIPSILIMLTCKFKLCTLKNSSFAHVITVRSSQ